MRLTRASLIASAIVAAAVTFADAASAQTCLGYPSFRRGAVRVNAGGYTSSDGQAYAGAVSAGRADGV
ncbi:MAG: hypothetical protein ACT4R6_04865, partial [Gemmatimonadaceae bacterium]